MACRGVLFALSEEQAQGFLAAQGDEEVRDLVYDVEESWDVNYLQETDKAWDAIHRCLSDGTTNFEAGVYPLNRCILGGKHLYDGDDYVVTFVTSSEVRDVALSLKDITEAWFRERFFALTGTDYPQCYINEEGCQYAWDYLTFIKEFYQKAADVRRAVIFTVDQ